MKALFTFSLKNHWANEKNIGKLLLKYFTSFTYAEVGSLKLTAQYSALVILTNLRSVDSKYTV